MVKVSGADFRALIGVVARRMDADGERGDCSCDRRFPAAACDGVPSKSVMSMEDRLDGTAFAMACEVAANVLTAADAAAAALMPER